MEDFYNETPTAEKVEMSPLVRAFMAFGDSVYKKDSKMRWVEERIWQLIALMYQAKSWLNPVSTGRSENGLYWTETPSDKRKPRPMPVTNYFGKTIDSQANALGSKLPEIEAVELDDDPSTQRAAEMAVRAKDVIDQESGIIHLNPIVAKHVPLFGIVAVEDDWDPSLGASITQATNMQTGTTTKLGCQSCGATSDVPPATPSGTPCPACGSTATDAYEEQSIEGAEAVQLTSGKIVSDVISCFEFYLPRDCKDANLARRILVRQRKTLGELRRRYPELADNIQPDGKQDTAAWRLQTLKTLQGFSIGSDRDSFDSATIYTLFCYWDELPHKLQKMFEREAKGGEEVDAQTLQAMKVYGLFIRWQDGLVLDWGLNPLHDDQSGESYFPFTFYQWGKDPANIYSPGIGYQLIPLQRMLNQIDSLILLCNMSNSAGKWLWPKSQTTPSPDGSPTEVIYYDCVGPDKVKPEFVSPQPHSPMLTNFRDRVLNDFNSIGLSEAVSQGQAPGGGVTAFRGLAYLGAKAAEQIATPRALWEAAHELRYKKCLLWARLKWDEPRKAKVAGPNGRFKAQTLSSDDLTGNYEIALKVGSSKPKLMSEKLSYIQMALEGKLIDPADQEVKKTLFAMFGLSALDPADKLHYDKAERDLDKVRRGEVPYMSDYVKWDVELKVATEYILTEEFENEAPDVQQRILMFAQQLNLQMSELAQSAAIGQMATQALAGGGSAAAPPAAPEGNLSGAIAGAQNSPGQALSQIPAQGAPVEQAAAAEGNNVAQATP